MGQHWGDVMSLSNVMPFPSPPDDDEPFAIMAGEFVQVANKWIQLGQSPKLVFESFFACVIGVAETEKMLPELLNDIEEMQKFVGDLNKQQPRTVQ